MMIAIYNEQYRAFLHLECPYLGSTLPRQGAAARAPVRRPRAPRTPATEGVGISGAYCSYTLHPRLCLGCAHGNCAVLLRPHPLLLVPCQLPWVLYANKPRRHFLPAGQEPLMGHGAPYKPYSSPVPAPSALRRAELEALGDMPSIGAFWGAPGMGFGVPLVRNPFLGILGLTDRIPSTNSSLSHPTPSSETVCSGLRHACYHVELKHQMICLQLPERAASTFGRRL